MKSNYILLAFLFVLAIGMCSASIETLGTVKQYGCIQLVQVCSTCTYNQISLVQRPDKTFSLNGNYSMQRNYQNYNLTFCDTNQTGLYSVAGHGNINSIDTPFTYSLTVTPNGQDNQIGSAVMYIGLLAVLIIFLILSIYSFVTFDNLLNRVGMLGLSYLLFTAITFIAWRMASDFLTSSPFLIDMLNLLFTVLMIGSPFMVIGGFIWYFLMLFKVKEIERLMSRGLTGEEAERRVNRK